jgi:tetratricopeptide (TPR) repeat protein
LDKIVSIKRKAQRFVQSGDVAKAVAEYESLVESGEMDPYDFVYLGDLLVKINRPGHAVDRYRDAIAAYERVGLYKNAIAVGKKILRIRPESFDIHRLVGNLYFLEGLFNDSLYYYMQFLSVAPADAEANSIEEVGLRLLGMPLPSPEVALNVVSTMKKANCAGQAARPLFALAREFEQRGSTDWAEPLRKKALELDPDVATEAVPRDSGYTSAAPATFEPPLAFESTRVSERRESPAAAHIEPGLIEHGYKTGPDEFGVLQLPSDDSSGPYGGPNGALRDAGGRAFYDVGSPAPNPAGIEPPAPGEIPISTLLADDSDIDPLDFRAMIARGEEHLANGDSARGLRVLLAGGRVAFNAGESRAAENVYVEMVKLDPNHVEALTGLTEIAHINGERSKIVRYGCELGDVLLALERYADAKLEFERVLQFDAGNEKAKARVRRLNSIDGMEQVTARPLAPVASEVKGATVSIRKEPTRTQSILDLSEIMNEFQSAVASQFPPEDAQSHYDLGMTYHEMGMHDQAVSEFEIAKGSPNYRARATEMIARCLLSNGRPEDALRIIEDTSPGASEDGDDARANLFACRGLALEALGRANEAVCAFEMALTLDPELIMAREAVMRLRGDAPAAA